MTSVIEKIVSSQNLSILTNNLYADFNISTDIMKSVKKFKNPTIGHLFSAKQYRIVQDIIDRYDLYPVIINDSDRPEYLAYRLYGSVEYFWVLLVCNNIINPYSEWIMSQESLYEYCKQKYKNLPEKENTVYYHKNSKGQKYYNVVEYPKDSGLWFDKLDKYHRNIQFKGSPGEMIPTTYLEHEIELNEQKRIVNALKPEDFGFFIQDLIQEGVLSEK